MAEEDEGGGGPAPAGGSVLKKYGPLAAIVLLVQVVVAWVVIKTLLDPSSSEDRDPGDPLIPQQQVQAAISEEEGSGLPYQHPAEPIKITFNPAETNSERFAVLEIVLGLMATNEEGTLMTPAEVGADAASLALVDANMKLIRRSILRVLREKTIDDLESMNVEEVWKDVKSALNEEVFSKIAWVDPDSESKKRVSIQEIIPTAIIVQ
jgi:flagellar basal body-associated protein FliL